MFSVIARCALAGQYNLVAIFDKINSAHFYFFHVFICLDSDPSVVATCQAFSQSQSHTKETHYSNYGILIAHFF